MPINEKRYSDTLWGCSIRAIKEELERKPGIKVQLLTSKQIEDIVSQMGEGYVVEPETLNGKAIGYSICKKDPFQTPGLEEPACKDNPIMNLILGVDPISGGDEEITSLAKWAPKLKDGEPSENRVILSTKTAVGASREGDMDRLKELFMNPEPMPPAFLWANRKPEPFIRLQELKIERATKFLKDKGLIKEGNNNFIIKQADGSQINLAQLLEEYRNLV